jgi:hypothetical protein
VKHLSFSKNILPHLVAVSIFLFVVVILFHPLILGGKYLSQHDILQWEGGAKQLIDYREATGEEGLWTQSMFGGMPAHLVNLVFSGDLIIYIQKTLTLGLPHPANLIFAAFLGFYILLLNYGVRPWLAIAGALVYGLASFNLIGIAAGHNAKIGAVAFLPIAFAGIHLAFKKRYLWGFLVTALGLALELRINHLQITYYLLLIVLVYGAFQLVYHFQEKRLPDLAKALGVLSLAALLAVGTNFGRLWTIYEYGKYSTRGASELVSNPSEGQGSSGLAKDYAFHYSNGIWEPMTLFVPNFFGGASQESLGEKSHLAKAMERNGVPRNQILSQLQAVPTYWGDQPLSAPYYLGAFAIFLFVLGLVYASPRDKWWMLVVVVFSIMLTWGKNFETFNYLMFDYFPGYNKFRSVTFAIVMAAFGMTLLGFVALEKLLQEGMTSLAKKKLLMAGGITGGLALVIWLLAGMGGFRGAVDYTYLSDLPDWFINALRDDRKSMMRMDALRSLFYIAAGFGLIWFHLKNKMGPAVAYFGLISLVSIDSIMVNKRYLNETKFSANPSRQYFQETEADAQILRDTSKGYRVTNLMNPFNEAKISYRHASVGGYHGAKIKRYQDLIDYCLNDNHRQAIQELQKGSRNFATLTALNMLNTKYLVAGNSRDMVFENPHAWGAAWPVQEIKKVNTANEEIEATCALTSKEVAVVNTQQFALTTTKFITEGEVHLRQELPSKLTYEANLSTGGLVVFSQIYYPEGWRATINGTPAPILRANYLLRALEVPAGTSTIEFEFAPRSYYTGNKVMWAASLLLIGLWVAGLVIWVRKGPSA